MRSIDLIDGGRSVVNSSAPALRKRILLRDGFATLSRR